MSCTIPSKINVTSIADETVNLLSTFSPSLDATKNIKFSVQKNAFPFATYHDNILFESARLSRVGATAQLAIPPFIICGLSATTARPLLTVDLTTITMDNTFTTIDQNQ